MGYSSFLNLTSDITENKRQRHATLPFLKIDKRHWGPPSGDLHKGSTMLIKKTVLGGLPWGQLPWGQLPHRTITPLGQLPLCLLPPRTTTPSGHLNPQDDYPYRTTTLIGRKTTLRTVLNYLCCICILFVLVFHPNAKKTH